MTPKKSKYIGLAVVTVGCLIVILTVGTGSGMLGWVSESAGEVAPLKIPPTPVAVLSVHPQPVEITDSYSGFLRPFERYTLAFEVSGRIESFGKNAQGRPLDEGDTVTAQQELAQLETTLLRAQLDEAAANLQRAQADLDRGTRLRNQESKLITDAEYLQWVTEQKLSEARMRMAEKNLQNATLRSPVAGRISKRFVTLGHSVTVQQPVFEVLDVESVILVVGVPEARVRDIAVGQRVDVELTARDRFGRKFPRREGRVYQVGEAADDATSLFQVEILISNQEGDLKPGLIAVAHIVVDTIRDGFRLPIAAAVERDGRMMLFSVGPDLKAREWPLDRWLEQSHELILTELPPEHRRVVVRGQHRLVDGRTVDIVDSQQDSLTAGEPSSTSKIE